MKKSVLCGGTFDSFHSGHKALLEVSFLLAKKMRAHLCVGVTSSTYAKKSKLHNIETYQKRRGHVEIFLHRLGSDYEIVELNDQFGPAKNAPSGSIICVSAETRNSIKALNKIRQKLGFGQLDMAVVPMVLSEDFLRISTSRVRSGAISADGKRLKPIIISVGSKNPVKLQGATQACKSLFGSKFRVLGADVKSGIPDQPFGHDVTLKGAKNRAKRAYDAGICDYGVGFESGLVSLGKMHFDVQFCAVYEPDFGFSIGHSMGFNVPDSVIKKIRREGLTLGDVMSELSGIEKIGNGGGAIYHLSGGRLHRSEMVRESLLCAMIPRIAKYDSIF